MCSQNGDGPGECPKAVEFVLCASDWGDSANNAFLGMGGVENGVGPMEYMREVD